MPCMRASTNAAALANYMGGLACLVFAVAFPAALRAFAPALATSHLVFENSEQFSRLRQGCLEQEATGQIPNPIQDSFLDPWGQPWRWCPGDDRIQRAGFAYSTGPNGVDEFGRGDDVCDREIYSNATRARAPAALAFRPRSCIALLSICLAAWPLLMRMVLHRRVQSSPARKLMNSILFAAPAIFAGVYLSFAMAEVLPAQWKAPFSRPWLPLSWTLGGTWTLFAVAIYSAFLLAGQNQATTSSSE